MNFLRFVKEAGSKFRCYSNVFVIVIILSLISFQTTAKANNLPIEYFLKDPAASDVRLSPDGKHFAIVFKKNDKDFLAVLDSQSKKPLGVYGIKGRRRSVGKVHWVNNTRLIYGVTESYFRYRGKYNTGELFGVNIDGSKHNNIFGYRSGRRTRTGHVRDAEFGGHRIISLLNGDPKHILVAFYPWRQAKYGLWKADHDAKTIVYKLNIYNGSKETVETLPFPDMTATADRDGVVRFISRIDDNNDGRVLYRADRNSEWSRIHIDGLEDSDVGPFHFTKDNQNVYISANSNEVAEAIYLYNLKKRTVKLIYSSKSVEIGRVIYDFSNDRIVAIASEETYPKYHYLNKKDKLVATHRKLVKKFAGRDVVISSVARDGSSYVAYAYADNQPPKYYLFLSDDIKSGAFLLNARKRINPSDMAVTESINIETKDGQKIHTYLTWPSNNHNQNLPMVVYVHGGPHGVRDYWGFDGEVQLLANRGYAVLQVNFRGSGGFGNSFESAGYGKWGTLMQDDVTDATRYFIEKQIADPSRICILGFSYGGYAALMGSIREPSLYKCAIGAMGVYDLELMFNTGDIAEQESGLSYLKEVLGTDKADLDKRSPINNVNKIKANILLIHGRKDERVPIAHAKSLMKAFDRIDKPYQWLEIENEGHSLNYSKNRFKVFSKILKFLSDNIGH